MSKGNTLTSLLSKRSPFFGVRLWIVIGVALGILVVLVLFILSLCLASRRRSSRSPQSNASPPVSKEIKEVTPAESLLPILKDKPSVPDSDKVRLHVDFGKKQTGGGKHGSSSRHTLPTPSNATQNHGQYGNSDYIELTNPHMMTFRSNSPSPWPYSRSNASTPMAKDSSTKAFKNLERRANASDDSEFGDAPSSRIPQVSHLGWGHWYTLQELNSATDGFSGANVLGEGGYGIVYRGLLSDGTSIAVKNLLNNRGQAEKEFRSEVDAIGKVRHKNLVRLLGFCVEGNHRMLVYDYVDNGNLEQWLHGQASPSHSVTWELRMKIALGTAKALAYLHEALEPKVVHRDIKASNILVDRHWNPKVSDFGLAKLLAYEKTHVTTRVMGTFGYVAPEYAKTGFLNERSDVYSFGVLFMEIITGRDPVDYSRPTGEVNLVDWLKMMVGSRRSDEVADPRLEPKPSQKSLKRMLLVALRCVDPDPSKRPKMGHVVHMLNSEEYPYHNERTKKDFSGSKHLEKQNPECLIQGTPTNALCSRMQHQMQRLKSDEVVEIKEVQKQGPGYKV